jgi:hypothetical protein
MGGQFARSDPIAEHGCKEGDWPGAPSSEVARSVELRITAIHDSIVTGPT